MGKRFTEKGLYFADAEKTILIGCSNAIEGILKIPTTTVTIGKEAFTENRTITGIDFSECKNLKAIEMGAFSYCQKLIKLDFSGCTSLLSLNEAAFFECSSLTEVVFPSNLNEIGEKTFYACNSLTEIKFPPKLKTIGSRAFADCKNITSLDLSACVSLDKISTAAFRGCIQAEVKMPASIETIETYALGEISDNDENLMCRKVIVPDYTVCKKIMNSSYPLYRIIVENRVIENGLCFADPEKTILIGEEDINSGILKIPETVVTIGAEALQEMKI